MTVEALRKQLIRLPNNAEVKADGKPIKELKVSDDSSVDLVSGTRKAKTTTKKQVTEESEDGRRSDV